MSWAWHCPEKVAFIWVSAGFIRKKLEFGLFASGHTPFVMGFGDWVSHRSSFRDRPSSFGGNFIPSTFTCCGCHALIIQSGKNKKRPEFHPTLPSLKVTSLSMRSAQRWGHSVIEGFPTLVIFCRSHRSFPVML